MCKHLRHCPFYSSQIKPACHGSGAGNDNVLKGQSLSEIVNIRPQTGSYDHGPARSHVVQLFA